MADYSIQEFANRFGKSAQTINKTVSRGKLTVKIKTENGKTLRVIDDTDIINKAWIRDKEPIAQPQHKPPSPTHTELKSTLTKQPPANIDVQDEYMHAIANSLSDKLKLADLRKREEEIKKLQLQNAKMEGELIPFDPLKVVFTMAIKAAFSRFEQDFINRINTVNAHYGGDAAYRGKQTAEARKDVNRIAETCEKELIMGAESILIEYQEVRGKGERK